MLRAVRGRERSPRATTCAWHLALALVTALLSAHAARAQAPGAPSPGPRAVAAPTSTSTTTTGAPETAERALALASYAFEYRDFARVVATLDPWVHPPRIADRARLAEAQRLLGISLHIQGNVEGAEAEFAAVLQADPELRLDPFVVPPAVIDTFERMRSSMRAVLDQILADRGRTQATPPAPEPPAALRLSPVFAYAPLGLSHFLALDEPAWGALWLGLQVAGLAANATGYFWGSSLIGTDGQIGRDQVDAQTSARTLQLTGLAVFAATWLASGLHAHTQWPNARPEPGLPATTPAPTGFALRFE
jgi:hypothetical protein